MALAFKTISQLFAERPATLPLDDDDLFLTEQDGVLKGARLDALFALLAAPDVNDVVGLLSGGKIDISLLPALTINDTFVVASQAAMLALVAQRGDIAIRSDISKTFVLSADAPAVLANWIQLPDPVGLVPNTRLVNGHPLSADVTVTKGDVGLGNVDNTSDVDKPVSTAQATALALKAPLADPTFTGAVNASQAFRFGGVISPAQLTVNTNDWAPTGFQTATIVRFSTNASRDITGLDAAGIEDGEVKILVNIGTQNAVLKDESISSAAANRFALSADITLAGDQALMLEYDTISARWRVLGGTGGGGTAAGTTFTPVSSLASTDVQAAIAEIMSQRVGELIIVLGSAATPGTLKANGALISRTTYSALWTWANASGMIVTDAAWATDKGKFSQGDGSTTFRLPDLRGEWIRAWDDARGIDSGRAIGSSQAEMIGPHNHPYLYNTGYAYGPTFSTLGVTVPPQSSAGSSTAGSTNTGTENRVRNVAYTACIRY